jgi:acetoin utilization protein AcuC
MMRISSGSGNKVEVFITKARPRFILFQCGADSIADDPLTHLRYSPKAHTHAAKRLCEIADRYGEGRILGMGGGGYDPRNIAATWTAVVRAFLSSSE